MNKEIEKKEKREKRKGEREEIQEIEKCIACHKKTEYFKSTPIDQRKYYVKGCGQLCEDCFDAIYD